MKVLLILLLVYWVGQRLWKIFAVVGQDQTQQKGGQTSYTPPKSTKKKIIPDDKGEYVDYEEVD